MNAETILYVGSVTLIVFVFGVLFSFEINKEKPTQIDYSDRFDRMEAGIQNSTIDVCFQWGGQWLTDENSLVTRDFEIPVENGLFARGQAIMCIKQKQGVQQ